MGKLQVFGSFELVRDDGVQMRVVLAEPKRTALLCCLAVDRLREFRQAEGHTLLSTFWPEKGVQRTQRPQPGGLPTLRSARRGSGVGDPCFTTSLTPFHQNPGSHFITFLLQQAAAREDART